MSHTPGPWTSYPCNLEAYSQVITAKGCMVQIANTGVRGHVAMTKEVYGDRMTYGPCEETMANARLIAAAPDLLAALKLAFQALDAIGDEMTVGERYTNAGQYLIDSLNPARAAIKKAEGQS